MEVLDKDGLDYFWDKIKNYVDSEILTKMNINVPVGTIIIWPGENIPNGWDECNGDLMSINKYNELFNVIGHQYSLPSDDDNTLKSYFRKPNIMGRMVVGKTINYDEFGYLGNTGGGKTHTITQSELPQFNYIQPTGTNTGHGTSNQGVPNTYTNDWASIGDDQPMDIMNPYIVLKYIIKIEPTEV